jgi:hypothetical protein
MTPFSRASPSSLLPLLLGESTIAVIDRRNRVTIEKLNLVRFQANLRVKTTISLTNRFLCKSRGLNGANRTPSKYDGAKESPSILHEIYLRKNREI